MLVTICTVAPIGDISTITMYCTVYAGYYLYCCANRGYFHYNYVLYCTYQNVFIPSPIPMPSCLCVWCISLNTVSGLFHVHIIFHWHKFMRHLMLEKGCAGVQGESVPMIITELSHRLIIPRWAKSHKCFILLES